MHFATMRHGSLVTLSRMNIERERSSIVDP